MPRPALSWLPSRLLPSALAAGYPALEDWLTEAYVLGLRHVELHAALLPSLAPEGLRALRRRLERHELAVSLLLGAPDLTHPDPQVRAAQERHALVLVEAARVLGAPGLRLTAGCSHDEVARADGVIWSAEALLRLAQAADRARLKLVLENHYRDRAWEELDFALETEVLLELLARLRDSSVGLCYNTANPLLTATDPGAILVAFEARLWHVHASDRFPGQHGHTVLGQGAVDFDALLARLVQIGYRGGIGLEDNGPAGEAGTRAGLAFLRRQIARWWP